MKLHIGCGGDIKAGWVNIDSGADGPDFCARADLVLDVRRGLPYGDKTVDFIYAQHFFEHLSADEGLQFLRDCKRVLVPGGVVRLSVPDLAEFVRIYVEGSARDLDTWKPEGWKPETHARMLNEEMRWWGHQFIYDYAELVRSMQAAGFNLTTRRPWGESDYAELAGLETRPKHWNDLIVEARAP